MQILLSMIFGLLSIMRARCSGEMGKIGALLRAHPGILEWLGAIRTKSLSRSAHSVRPQLDPDDALQRLGRAAAGLRDLRRREVPYGAD